MGPKTAGQCGQCNLQHGHGMHKCFQPFFGCNSPVDPARPSTFGGQAQGSLKDTSQNLQGDKSAGEGDLPQDQSVLVARPGSHRRTRLAELSPTLQALGTWMVSKGRLEEATLYSSGIGDNPKMVQQQNRRKPSTWDPIHRCISWAGSCLARIHGPPGDAIYAVPSVSFQSRPKKVSSRKTNLFWCVVRDSIHACCKAISRLEKMFSEQKCQTSR